MTILVTGGAGYVGAVLVPKLLGAGNKVTVLDAGWYGVDVLKKHKNLRFVKGDLRNPQKVEGALHGVEMVIHLACISNDPSYDLAPEEAKHINFHASKDFIDAAKKRGVTRFVYASSSSVYGVRPELEITEEVPLTPRIGYSEDKVRIEKYLLSVQTKDFTTLIFRPATVCGYSPRLRLDLIVNMLTAQAYLHKRIRVIGGTNRRPNIHIGDMTDAYMFSMKWPRELIAGKIYNVGYRNYTLVEIATMIKQTIGDDRIIIDVEETSDNRSYHISSKKIEEELGFVPVHSIQEAIRDLGRAFRSGILIDPLTDTRYYNVKRMKEVYTNAL